MDPPPSGFVLDSSKCSNPSFEKKRELIRQLSKRPETAAEKLQSWSRRDLIDVLCAEKGKERKYSGLAKQKLIELLLRTVSEKKSGKHIEESDTKMHLHPPSPPSDSQTPLKRQRKADHPSRLPAASSNLPVSNGDSPPKSIQYCKNLSCRATISQKDDFCKRCSCCICHKYDENKDPSLWLVCSSEAPSEGDPCGLSCHVECAIKHERAGISKNGQSTRLDGSYYCISCGKVNDLLRCWRKQLVIAKDARRVDILCNRISLSHKLLSFTEMYKSLHEIVDAAMKKLESEVGLLSGLPSIARGIVNRLSVGAEVQGLCAHAVESLDSMFSSALPFHAQIHKAKSGFFKFEEMSPTSVTLVLGSENDPSILEGLIGFTLWIRKADATDYPSEPTHTLLKANKRLLISNLTPATRYMIKVIASNNTSELAKWEIGITTETIKSPTVEVTSTELHYGSPKTNSSGRSNPSSEGDESNNTSALGDLNKFPDDNFGYHRKPEIIDSGESSEHASKQISGIQNQRSGTTIMMPTEEKEAVGDLGSALDEEPNSVIQTESHRDSTNSTEHNHMSDAPKSDNESNTPIGNEMAVVPYGIFESTVPGTPCRLETGKEGSGRSCSAKPSSNLLQHGPAKPESEPGSSSKKRCDAKYEEKCIKDGSLEVAYEYCVKVVRWLECEGYIESNFRVKFLTWFSLRATAQERRVVNVYVDTLIDDPTSLAGQLVDSFSEAVCSKRPPPVPIVFCPKLWH